MIASGDGGWDLALYARSAEVATEATTKLAMAPRACAFMLMTEL